MKLTYARTTHPNETVSYTVNGIKGSLFVTFQLHQALMAAAVDGVITVSLSGAPVVEGAKGAKIVDANELAAFKRWQAEQAAPRLIKLA